ncbi:DBR1-domain-containing protein [Rickenella mellea]|uniref:DBR1-domain-containing protein n=1 Tax=Rickenella mellea TaxID=50990 RepID=A0A4Y7PU37_9AGAM|nr:DBR1-domain-containing protein [Rickenella mellea]
MKVAIEGCCHGQLNAIYKHIAELEAKDNYKVDLLICCGDFQAMRNRQDLQCMAAPEKYRDMGDFHSYYTGERTAPMLTLVIGGNHEASAYLWELYHGGWLAPNIYFLGHAGCVQVNGVRIAGTSGIFKGNDFHQGHWEKLPYTSGSMRSIYHVREYNIKRLSLLSSPNIVISHDWPQGIEHHGDLRYLLQRKPFFRGDIASGQLGSPPLMGLLKVLKPDWWFSAHLHVRFTGSVLHDADDQPTAGPPTVENPDEISIEDEDDDTTSKEANTLQTPQPTEDQNPDEIVLDEEIETVATPPKPVIQRETKFIALDKCLPRRQFLEVIDIPTTPVRPRSGKDKPDSNAPRLTFDPEWLAVTRAFHPFLSTTRHQPRMPDEEQAREMVRTELEWVLANVGDKAERDGLRDVDECQVFWATAPGPGGEQGDKSNQPPWYTNPQTVAFCAMLEIDNKINPPPPQATYSSPDAKENPTPHPPHQEKESPSGTSKPLSMGS